MKVSKGLAIIVSIIFFFDLVIVFLGVFLSLFPGYSFSDNSFVRFIFLIAIIYITRSFYSYLRGESKEDDSNQEVIQEDSGDDNKKIAIWGVIGVFVLILVILTIMSI